MNLGLVGRKIGMTRVFQEDGSSVPVSVVHIQDNRIAQLKQKDKDNYEGVVVAVGTQKPSRLNRPKSAFYAKTGIAPARKLKEFRVDNAGDYKVQQALDVTQFQAGQMLDVTGVSKGKGFQGGVKRHNFKTQDATHGNSLSHRALGSTGQNQSPGKVFKGKKMPGQMGNEQVTTINLELVEIDVERSLLLIKGAVPGHAGADVVVRPAVKKPFTAPPKQQAPEAEQAPKETQQAEQQAPEAEQASKETQQAEQQAPEEKAQAEAPQAEKKLEEGSEEAKG